MPKILKIIFIVLFLFSVISFAIYSQIKPFLIFLPHLNYLLGQEKPVSYIVLLQNDTEMRANGGFAGSYAKVVISSEAKQSDMFKVANIKKPNISIDFQDIYVPNGQLKGYVKPPQPIQDSFQHGTWELANADWEPDFPTAAKSIRWFFEKGGEINPDVLATLSLSTIKDILKIVGPFKVPDLNAEITSDNIYQFLQGKAETDFFPGSTQKKDALTSVGTALKYKFSHLNPIQYLKIANIILKDLNNQNILINSTNENFQNFLSLHHLDGKIIPGAIDTYMLVETNLGANKANCCIDRQTTHTITQEGSSFLHKISLILTNKSEVANPYPPFTYSGNYVAYLRFYIPKDAFDIDINPKQSSPSTEIKVFFNNNINIGENHGLKEIGFFHITAAGTQSTVDLSYRTATGSAAYPYNLKILKQNGLISSPSTINYNNQTYSTNLKSSFNLPLP